MVAQYGTATYACLAAAMPASAAPLLTSQLPPPVAAHIATRLGPAAANTQLTLAIALPMHDKPALAALLRDVYDAASPHYRHYLSVSEFAARFSPTESQYKTAVLFFAAAGLHVAATSANRAMIDAQGSVADVERVFHITLGRYQHPTENRIFISPDREPSLDLALPVLHVAGLDTYELPKPRRIFHGASAGESVSRKVGTGSGPNGNFIGSDVRAAYYAGTRLTGRGQALGLMELQGWNPADITRYFAVLHQNNTVPIIGISTDGAAITCIRCDDGEQALDIQYAASMAPGLEKIQVYVAHSPESVLNRMASDNTSKQLSTSWGWPNDFAVDDPLFQEMAVQGQTFLTASGDYSSLHESGPWPEEDANLTAVGGTDLVTSGPGGPWVAETGWNGSAGGPSLDRHIKIPAYQSPFVNGINRGSRFFRNVPDIAADANTNNFQCFNGACQGGWGGTSFASPIWAGMVALINEKLAAEGKPPVGFLNRPLYAFAGTSRYHQVLHDENTGASGIYSANRSYDLVTGLGSPLGSGLEQVLAACCRNTMSR
jgi:subtilase family serine protease